MLESLNRLTGGQAPVALAIAALILTYLLALAIRYSRGMREGAAWGPRIGKYIGVAASGWLMTAAVLVLVWCIVLRNPSDTFAAALDDMGLHTRLPANDLVVWSAAMLFAATFASYVITYLRKALGGGPSAAALDLLPETPAETAVFSLVVAPTAGIGEEIVYRGFLMGNLWGITGDAWLAAGLSSVVFGLMHIYQGWWGVLRTSVIGFVFALGVIMTGSLLPSIFAHTMANMLGVVFRKPVPRPAPA